MPILTWARTYQRGWWGRDAIAGLTMWGLLVPEGMAYAGIADLPPQVGLYTLGGVVGDLRADASNSANLRMSTPVIGNDRDTSTCAGRTPR